MSDTENVLLHCSDEDLVNISRPHEERITGQQNILSLKHKLHTADLITRMLQ